MLVEKHYIGKNQINGIYRHYYLLKRRELYGIEILEEYDDKLLSVSEYFTPHYESADRLAQLLYKGCVTLITFLEILDDYTTMEQFAI